MWKYRNPGDNSKYPWDTGTDQEKLKQSVVFHHTVLTYSKEGKIVFG